MIIPWTTPKHHDKLSDVSDYQDNIPLTTRLGALNLTADEADIYICLLQNPNTHLQVSRETGIARTKVYRIADQLEKRRLITRHSDASGTFLIATDPAILESEIAAQETKLKEQRAALKSLLPSLSSLQGSDNRQFTVHIYEGREELRQMCWHELKAKGEMLIMGGGELEELVPHPRWAKKYRAIAAQATYKIRHLADAAGPCGSSGSDNYAWRSMPAGVESPTALIMIYNDTVAHYHWRESQKIGVEIINNSHANMMRDLFNLYWQMTDDQS